MEVHVKGATPLRAAVTADSPGKGFDVRMEEPAWETHVTGLLTHPRVGNESRAVSDFSLATKLFLLLAEQQDPSTDQA